MTQTQAIIATEHAQKYMTQLCKHWSHKFETTLDDTTGTVDLPGGRVSFKASEAELKVNIALKSEDAREKMQAVIAEHLDRFAFRELPITYNWT